MNLFKQTAVSLLEKSMAKTAVVLDIRPWSPATIIEIDLHMPGVHMEKWTSVQHIKMKVAPFVYRDYTPALWDAETRTCTLIIDTSHEGSGSSWAMSLKKGDDITYIGIGATPHKPLQAGNRMVCMGDASTIAHFLALQQLAGKTATVQGLISFKVKEHTRQFASYFQTALKPVFAAGDEVFHQKSWLKEHMVSNDIVYLAGHTPKVVELRRFIRGSKGFNGAVKAQGFWE